LLPGDNFRFTPVISKAMVGCAIKYALDPFDIMNPGKIVAF
jgi:hypothetical protein